MTDLPVLMIFVHTFSMIFWIGGLFAYLFIVWPSIFKLAQGKAFPREMLGMLAHKTAPWIYLAMLSALVTAIGFLFLDSYDVVSKQIIIAYVLILCLLIGNNTYGTVTGWAKILWAPKDKVVSLWRWFYIRMFLSFLVGMALLLGQLVLLLQK